MLPADKRKHQPQKSKILLGLIPYYCFILNNLKITKLKNIVIITVANIK